MLTPTVTTRACTNCTSARVLEAQATYRRQPLTTTLVLSSGAIGDLIEVTARIRVAVVGREAVGTGSIYLSDLWA